MTSVPIVFICDTHYVMPTAVVITSIVRNKNNSTHYEFFIIGAGLGKEDKQSLQQAAGKEKVNFVDVDETKFSKVLAKTHVSPAALYKFEIANLLPQYDKVLYLDGDIVVQDDLRPLYEADLQDCYAGVVKDAYVLGEKHNNQGIEGYFNSGVMLLNCALMRRDNVAEKLMTLKIKHQDLLYMDQDVFNMAFADKVKFLDLKYNFMAAYFRKKYYPLLMEIYNDAEYVRKQSACPVIIHYTGKNPWEYSKRIKAEIWRRYYNLSPFAGQMLQYKDSWRNRLKKYLPQRQERADGKIEVFWMKHRLLAYWNPKSKFQQLYARRFDNTLTEEEKKYILTVQLGRVVDYVPNLDDPKTWNEKIQWLKLHYHNPLMTVCADKYAVRRYVAEKIGEEYLVPLVGVWDNPEDIDFDSLPEQFVLKINWGSGQNIVVRNKCKLNRKKSLQKLRGWMNPQKNHYFYGLEWAYKDIKPKVVAEQLLPLEKGPVEYKMFCFNGRFEFALLEINWNTPKHTRAFCTDKYSEAEFTIGNYKRSPLPEKDVQFETMRHLAEKLAEGFPCLRADFYQIEGKIYFGEMTFYSGSGYSLINPKMYDYEIGRLLTLPKPE